MAMNTRPVSKPERTSIAAMVMNEAASGPPAVLPTTAAPSVPITVAGTSCGTASMPGKLLVTPISRQKTTPPNSIMPAPCTAKGSIGPLNTMADRAMQ